MWGSSHDSGADTRDSHIGSLRNIEIDLFDGGPGRMGNGNVTALEMAGEGEGIISVY